jgi:hypothetical protein
MATCQGSFRALFLYDIAEEIDLAAVSRLIGTAPPARSPGFKLPAPGYVRFVRPPIVEHCGPARLAGGEAAEARLRYFDYGVVSLELELPFTGAWSELIALSSRWVENNDTEQRAVAVVREHIERIREALRKPYADWLDEVYFIVHLQEVVSETNRKLSAADLIAQCGAEIGQVIRGDTVALSTDEQREVLSSSMSYYSTDLLVVGWLSAIVYDSPEGATPVLELLEYANAQLLEYRRYDEILTNLLKQTYDALERRGGLLSRWKLAREAGQLNRLRLDIIELTERTDNAIKFLSDMFYARAYRLAAAKVGANDYRRLVDEKLRTAGELYEFMVNEFREARAFTLELLVVIILVVELIPILRGR